MDHYIIYYTYTLDYLSFEHQALELRFESSKLFLFRTFLFFRTEDFFVECREASTFLCQLLRTNIVQLSTNVKLWC